MKIQQIKYPRIVLSAEDYARLGDSHVKINPWAGANDN
jgi:hypothetical protein